MTVGDERVYRYIHLEWEAVKGQGKLKSDVGSQRRIGAGRHSAATRVRFGGIARRARLAPKITPAPFLVRMVATALCVGRTVSGSPRGSLTALTVRLTVPLRCAAWRTARCVTPEVRSK
eukprot:3251492-Pyramimonas_sp.AAC.1